VIVVKNKIKNNIKHQQGAALVIALLILSLTIVSATALGKVILGELRISLNARNSLIAFYAADTAIEKSLYYLKYNNIRGLSWPIGSLENETFYMYGSNANFTFQQISTSTPGYSFYDITTSSPAHIDIIDDVGNLPASIDWDTTNSSHYYVVDWNILDCFPDHVSDRLEITSYYFNNDPFDVVSDKDVVICNCSFDIDPDIRNACDSSLTTKTIFDNNFYRFSFRPLDGPVDSLFFNVWANPALGSDYLASSTANLYVVADGTYKNSQHRLTVEIPETSPISDIFSFVVFSEEVIRKE